MPMTNQKPPGEREPKQKQWREPGDTSLGWGGGCLWDGCFLVGCWPWAALILVLIVLLF